MSDRVNIFLRQLSSTRVLPVIPLSMNIPGDELIDHCYRCGIRAIEFRDNLAHRALPSFKAIAKYAERYEDFFLGVHTVSVRNAAAYCKDGASFISTSFVKEEMANVVNKSNKIWIPGAHSIEDFERATYLRAKIVSLLPGSCSPQDVAQLQNRFQDLFFLPSGGVELSDQNFTAWANAPVFCVRMSERSSFYIDIGMKNWSQVERQIRLRMAMAAAGKGNQEHLIEKALSSV